jgi:Spy/CpxP family protein refolding chaperone
METKMRKSILMGLGLAVSVASTAIAQQQDTVRGQRGKGPDRGGQFDRRGGPRGGPMGLLLKDITLTETQRRQIAQLHKTERDQMEAKRAQRQADFEKVREARQRGDTAAVRVAMQQRRLEMEQERAQNIAAVRQILTADQRVQFDKNVAELKAREAERAQRVGQRGAKGGKGQGREFRGGR